MKQVVKSADRGRTKIDWLDSFHSFSFGEYFDPGNMGFGPLRVINDDTILPSGGFPTHPHRDMEIITIVTEGAVAHRDNTGGEGLIRPGEVQKMTAGKGILHSEFNASDKHILKLYQIWILPNQLGLKPGYEEFKYNEEDKKNNLLLVASGDVLDGVVFINQEAKIFLSDLETSKNINYSTQEKHGVYIHVISGKLSVNNEDLKEGDAIKITNESNVNIEATESAKFILFDVVMNF